MKILLGRMSCACRPEGGQRHAALSDPLQLHARHLVQADPEPRGPPGGSYPDIEAVGGRLHGFWYAFGEHDAYAVWEAPDNVAMAATALAIAAGGALSQHHTTVLLSVEETLAALRKASTIAYRAPGSPRDPVQYG